MANIKHLSVGQQVILIFGLICGLLVAIGLLLFFSLRNIERSISVQQASSLSELTLIEDLAQDVGRMQANVLREIQTSDPGEIKNLDQAVRDIERTNAKGLDDYQKKFIYSKEEKQLYDRVMQARAAYWEQTQSLMVLAQSNRDAEAEKFINSTQAPAYDEYLNTINALTHYVENEAGEASEETTRFISKIRIIGDTLTGFALLVAAAAGLAIERIGRRLKKDNAALQAEVAARKEASRKLEESSQLIDGILKNSLDGIVAYEAIRDEQGDLMDFRFLLVNPSAERSIGQPASELIGRGLLDASPEIVLDGLFESFVRIVETGESLDFEYSTVRTNTMRWYRVAGVKLGDGLVMSYSDITERKMAEAKLDRLRKEHMTVLNSVSEGMHWIDLEGRIKFENPAATKMLGYELDELIGKQGHLTLHHSHPDGTPYPVDECPIYATMKDGTIRRVKDEVFWRKDGRSFPVEYTSTPVRDEHGQLAGTVVVFTDVTERKQLEARMFQSQKMETVGKLAGGVAHEFNSILTAIIGQSEFLLQDLPPDGPLGKSAHEIRQAADRAAVLTRQLLAYGRKQILQPEILDLNQVLAAMISTLQHLMGREINVRLVPALGLKMIKIDPGQMEQVIVNIAMNAADAMPNGGKFTLETANVTLDEQYVQSFPGLKAGGYVMLSMTDTGIGMSDEVKARAFEPFFSTKGVGQGTGLGLSTCYGILKQSDGHINVYSEVARGSTFKIYLPQVERQPLPALPRLSSPDLPCGTETILLAEDDPSLLEMSATLLRRLGYTVLTAVNGIEALSLKNQRDIGHIDLLFTDVVMPHMSGKELSDRIRAIYPDTKILFTSAYTESAIVHQGVLNEGVTLLQKPFTPSALANKVREVLDRPSPPPRE